MDQVTIPIHLDDPKYILLFTMEDFLIFMGCMLMGVLVHEMGYLMIGGLIVSWGSSKFRGSLPEGLLQHSMYWIGIPIGKPTCHSLLNPYIRKFIS